MYTLVGPSNRCFTLNLALIGQVFSEKKIFEYYSDIHVYCPRVGAHQPLGSIFFSESQIFSPFAHYLQVFLFKWHFDNFPYSNAWATYVDLDVE